MVSSEPLADEHHQLLAVALSMGKNKMLQYRIGSVREAAWIERTLVT